MNKNKLKTGKKEKISFYIDADMLKLLDKKSIQAGRMRSSMIREILFKYLTSNK